MCMCVLLFIRLRDLMISFIVVVYFERVTVYLYRVTTHHTFYTSHAFIDKFHLLRLMSISIQWIEIIIENQANEGHFKQKTKNALDRNVIVFTRVLLIIHSNEGNNNSIRFIKTFPVLAPERHFKPTFVILFFPRPNEAHGRQAICLPNSI